MPAPTRQVLGAPPGPSQKPPSWIRTDRIPLAATIVAVVLVLALAYLVWPTRYGGHIGRSCPRPAGERCTAADDTAEHRHAPPRPPSASRNPPWAA